MPADFVGLLAKGKAPVVAKAKGMPEKPELEEPEGMEDPLITRLKPIAQDFLDAVRGGDAEALAEAWIAGQSAIKAGPSDAESEIEEGEV